MMSVMARSKGKGLSVRPDAEQRGKIRAIAYAERRGLNDQILYFIDRGLEVFDREHPDFDYEKFLELALKSDKHPD